MLAKEAERLFKPLQHSFSLSGVLPRRCHALDECSLAGAAVLSLGNMPGGDFESSLVFRAHCNSAHQNICISITH